MNCRQMSTFLALAVLGEMLIISHVEAGVGRRNRRLSPIIIIPGKGGSQIESRITDHSRVHESCSPGDDWARIWFNIYDFLPFGGIECWSEGMALQYNTSARRSQTASGREFRVPGWGHTHAIEWVDPSWLAYGFGNVGAYAAHLVGELVTRFGYERGVSIRAAPYDFRFAPNSHEKFHMDLKALIEDTYYRNNWKKVVLLSHSLGGLQTNYFLNLQTQRWKDRFVESFISVNTPYHGAVILADLFAAGNDWDCDAIDRQVVRKQWRSYETGHFLLPRPDAWGPEEILVETPNKNYTAHNYEEFMEDVNYPLGKEIMNHFEDAWENIHHPGISTYCLYSHGTPTVKTVHFAEGEFPDVEPTKSYEDGDGTVNLRSLTGCKAWSNSHPRKTYVKAYDNTNHVDLFSDARVLRLIVQIVRRIAPLS